MSVSGLAPLRGPGDDGNFVWTSALVANAYEFGVGFLDDAAPIATTFSGKVDFMDDVFGPGAPLKIKSTDDVTLLLSAFSIPAGTTLTFTCQVTADLLQTTATTGTYTGAAAGAVYGSAIYGTAIYGGAITNQFAPIKVANQITAQGHVLGFTWSETSGYGWSVLGYIAYVNDQGVAV